MLEKVVEFWFTARGASALAKKPLTRIVANVSGVLRQFLSIRENSNDELILMIPTSANFEHPVRGDVPLTGVRWTLHKSLKSIEGGETFNCHILLADKTPIETAAFHLSRKMGRYFPIFAQRVSDLSAPKFDIPQRKKDQLINLGAYDRRYSSLVYALVASCPNDPCMGDAQGFNTLKLPFRYWDIHLIWSFMRFPSMPASDFSVAATNAPRENGAFVLDIQPLQTHYGRELADAWRDIYSLVRSISERTQKRIVKLGVKDQSILALAASYDKAPFDPTTDSAA